jgi:hypothetical protein
MIGTSNMFCKAIQGDMLSQLVSDMFTPTFVWAYRKDTDVYRLVSYENLSLLLKKKNMVFSAAFSLQDMISMADVYEVGLWDGSFTEHVFDDAPMFADWLILELLKTKKKLKKYDKNTPTHKSDENHHPL